MPSSLWYAGQCGLQSFDDVTSPLSGLHTVIISSNTLLIGSFPSFLSQQPLLRALDLSNNNFNGQVPGEALLQPRQPAQYLLCALDLLQNSALHGHSCMLPLAFLQLPL